ncbi:hypothetical protein PHLGIDRAFT_130769 [Phlebiopsis gigantea 11061_1 CR5-6]|uniref:MYND-type domain-containing protein n=1 Tax=Phlebiopsis gigantea (strain 11061_1 CR5-6) TaxID=745531 RepID=A0A0C3PBM1_PHLG1|nr:hypothetical protein PHLGIDRAFT_130769 [Phlebiopsis gigantea 11061_1 CR5-6]
MAITFSECQKADWKRHKHFCAAYSTLHKEIMTLDLPSDEPTHDMSALAARAMERAMDKKRILEFILGRRLSSGEGTLVNWEPRCLACARTEEDLRASAGEDANLVGPLIRCQACKLSFYCSETHREFARHTHENVPDSDSATGLSQCSMNQTLRGDLVVRELLRMDVDIPPPWAPDRVKARWEPLEGRSWASEYERELPAPPELVGPLLRNATDDLTLPQTILWALEKLNADDAWTRKDTLTLLGASQKEAMQGMVFEEIMHRLPELVLCGPDMDFITGGHDRDVAMETCPRCTRAGRKRIHSHVAKTYHDYVAAQGPAYIPPDLAIAFNSGVGQQETASWFPTVCLLVGKKVPTVFTAFNREEVTLDREVLVDAGAQLLPGLEGPNPWGSQMINTEPLRVNGYYANNMFITGGFASSSRIT